MKLMKLAVAAVLAVSAVAFAAEPAKPAEPAKKEAAKPAEPAKKEEAKPAAGAAAAPAMPTIPPEGKKFIEGNLGSWKASDVAMTMGDKTVKGKMTLKCDKTSNGWGTLCTGKADMGKEMPPQNVTFLMGWNIGDGEATMFEVSDAGEVHHHVGKWTDDKTITLTHKGKNAEGKVETDAVTLTWNSPKELVWKAEGTVDGKSAWTFTGTAKK
jgi:hypothetical protein